jgi:valyl-tRNA synthetase
MTAYFDALAGAEVQSIGPDTAAFETDAHLALPDVDVDVHVDLEKFIDVEAELARLEKLQGQLTGQISGKQNKLSNESFVSRAPADIVQKERESLAGLQTQLEAVAKDIEKLNSKK